MASKKSFNVCFHYPLPPKEDFVASRGVPFPIKLIKQKFKVLTPYESCILDFLVWKTYGEYRLSADISCTELTQYLNEIGKAPGGWRGAKKKPLPNALAAISKAGLAEITF